MTKALAYILMTAKHSYAKTVAEKLMQFDEVQNIHELFGQYDLIVKVLTDSNGELSAFVRNNISTMPEIERAETLIVIDVPKEG